MLAQKLIYNYSYHLILQFIQIIASLIVARVAGPEVLGTVSFGIAYVSIFSSFADLGFGTAHIKKISEGNEISNCLGTYTRIKFALISLFILIVILFYLIQKYIFNIKFESDVHIYVIFITLTAMSIGQIFSIIKVTFSSYTQVVKSSMPSIIKTIIYQILRIIVVLLGFRAIALSFSNLIAEILIIPYYLYLIKDWKFGQYDKELAKSYFLIAMPIMLVGILGDLTASLDKILLQFYNSSWDVGQYTAAFRVGGFVLLLNSSVSSLFFPTFSKAFSKNNFELIKTNLEKYERFTYLYIMPCVILLTLNTDLIVKIILGDQYLSAIAIMKVVNIAMFLLAISVPFGTVITGLGNFRKLVIINGVNTTLYVIILLVLIHPRMFHLSGIGAAFSLLLSNLFIGILYRIYAKKYVPCLSFNFTSKLTIYGVINFILFDMIFHYQFISDFIVNRILLSVLFLFLTYLTLALFGMFKKDDLYFIKTLMNLRSVGKYAREEISKK